MGHIMSGAGTSTRFADSRLSADRVFLPVWKVITFHK